ncbi:MAG: DUF6992 family protein [Fimbriimonadales bacterium]
MPFLSYQSQMMKQLLFWAGLCLGIALPMLFSSREWVRAFGGMTAGWSVVNALIALLALLGIRRKRAQNADEATTRQWMHQLVRLLWINVGLDVLYIIVGIGLTAWSRESRMLNAFGWAVIIQGAFLLVFDCWHAARLPKRVRLP